METYDGFPILLVNPNRREAPTLTFSRTGELLDGRAGARWYDDHAGIGRTVRTFNLFLAGRSEIDDLRTLAAICRGRALPFWVPTWQSDLALGADALAGATGIQVRSSGYVLQQFPLYTRRRLVITSSDTLTTSMIYSVTAASTVGALDSLEIAPGLATAATTGRTAIMYLLLVRLTEDLVRIAWETPDFAECELSVTEVLGEMPS